MIDLSFSNIKNNLQANNSHGYINRMMGIKIPTTPAMEKGKEMHRKLQQMIVENKFPLLTGFTVETKDQDRDMKIIKVVTEKYRAIGFLDGKRDTALLEIKTSGSKYWSVGDFYNSTQIQLYAFITNAQKIFCLTTLQEENAIPKIYTFEVDDSFKKKGERFMMDAIAILEKGSFKGGLDENGKCNIYCPYGKNCFFNTHV